MTIVIWMIVKIVARVKDDELRGGQMERNLSKIGKINLGSHSE